jgi:hypothetical protein
MRNTVRRAGQRSLARVLTCLVYSHARGGQRPFLGLPISAGKRVLRMLKALRSTVPPDALNIVLVLAFFIGLEREEHKQREASYAFGGIGDGELSLRAVAHTAPAKK